MALIHKALCLICILNHLDLELPIFDLKDTLLSCWVPQRGALRWQELDLDNFIDSNKGNSFAACLVPVYNPILRRDLEILRMTISGFMDEKFKKGCQQHSPDQNQMMWNQVSLIMWMGGGYAHPTYSKSVYTSLSWVYNLTAPCVNNKTWTEIKAKCWSLSSWEFVVSVNSQKFWWNVGSVFDMPTICLDH